MKKKGLFLAVLAMVAFAAIYAGTALAWHANGVTVTATCNLENETYSLSASIAQSSQYPGASVVSITPSSFPGSNAGTTQAVTVVIGWPNSNDKQTWHVNVPLGGTCTKPPPPPPDPKCPEGYTKSGESDGVLLCTKETVKEVPVVTTVVQTVPGPETVVEKRVEVPIEVIKEVPGPTVTKTVVKTVVKWKTRVVIKNHTKVVVKTKVVQAKKKACVCSAGFRLWHGTCHPIVRGNG